ncbi:MAG: Ig-like domain-containing protein [Lentimicrobium sp.]
MKNRKSYYSITAVISILLLAVGCERDLDGLKLATYPTAPEVFIDGFSSGLYYAAYGTSKVTAFSVDYDVKYKGFSSMMFAVPDTSDPNGSYVGGVFGTNPGRDLSGYNVLTFWAKASQPAVLNEVGFGSDMGESKYKVTLSNVTVNSNWMKYYVPIPDPSLLKQERGMFFYAAAPQNGRGYTFWIDEVQFENLGTIAHESAVILNGQDLIKGDAETDEVFQITDMYVSVNLPTGIDQRVSVAASYFTFTSSNPSVATVDNLGKVTVVGIGTAAITAKLGSLVTNGSITIIGIGQAPKPATPAPTPTVSSNSVISLFSNAYTNVTVDTWNTHWQYSTAENEDIQIDGDDVIRYRNLNFVGIEFTSQQINAGAMNSFHIDLWTPEATSGKTFKILLVDFGADGAYGGNDDSSSEVSIASPPLTTQNWVSLNIPMSSFSGLTSRTHLAQLVLSGDLPTVYIDNVYFFNSGTVPSEPTTAAPVPSFSADDVISVFSDSYTNLAGTDFNPYWEQTTVVTQVPVAGNNTLKYTGLNYQGIQLGGSQNISAMSYLHLDFWTATSTSLSVYLISSGPVETPKVLNVPTSGWTSVDIPLSEFSPVDLSDIIQFKFVGNGDIYLDNILFHK